MIIYRRDLIIDLIILLKYVRYLHKKLTKKKEKKK